MSPETFFIFPNLTRVDQDIVVFEAFEADDGLPFPLNLTSTKVFLSSTLVLILACGFRLRFLIFKYLNTINFKVGQCYVLAIIDGCCSKVIDTTLRLSMPSGCCLRA